MEDFSGTSGYDTTLVDQAFSILMNNNYLVPTDDVDTLTGAATVICNHIGGVIGLTKVELTILVVYTTGLSQAETYDLCDHLANVVRSTRPEGSMTVADVEFLNFVDSLPAREAEDQATADSAAGSMTVADIEFLNFLESLPDKDAEDQMAAESVFETAVEHPNQGPYDGTLQNPMQSLHETMEVKNNYVDNSGASSSRTVFCNVLSPDGTPISLSSSSFTMTRSTTFRPFPAFSIPVGFDNSVPFNTEAQAQAQNMYNAPQRAALGGFNVDVPDSEQSMELDVMAQYPQYLNRDGMF